MPRAAAVLALAVALAMSVAIAALLAGRGAGAAPNLVSNSAFDADVAGWAANNPETGLAFDSAAGNPPGSARLQAVAGTPPVAAEAVTACIDLTASGAGPGTYNLAADVLLPTSATAGDVIAVSVDLFADAACATPAGTVTAATSTLSDAWQPLSTTAPIATEQGAVIRVTLTAGAVGDNARFDNVVLSNGPADTPTPLPTDTPTSTPTATDTAVPTATDSPTLTDTATPTAT
ncbi:MAG TPA: hypothetical protein VFC53_12740, partial [Dehalococcoidia bacterium]|nr:hypothetical protein [Dehalococcoidia bacterium]